MLFLKSALKKRFFMKNPWIQAFLNNYHAFVNDQRGRFYLWLPVWFGCGIGLYFSLPFEPSVAHIIFLCTAQAFLMLLGIYVYSWLRLGAYASLFMVLGFCFSFYRVGFLNTFQLNTNLYSIRINGTVLQSTPRVKGVQVDVEFSDNTKNILGLSRVRLYSHTALSSGSYIQGVCHLWPIPLPLGPYDYHMRRELYFQKIGALGRCSSLNLMHQRPLSFFTGLRERISQKLGALFKDHGVHRALARALITGEKREIPSDVRDSFTQAGLAHILAISGLHMSLLAGVCFFLCRRLCLLTPRGESPRYLKLCALAALGLSFFYLNISGFGIPAQRAFLMLCFFVLALLIHKTPWSLYFLSTSAFLILLFKPENLLSVSFQLSFAAVLALIGHYQIHQKKSFSVVKGSFLRKVQRGFISIKLMLMTTLLASIATAPFTLYHFNQANPQAFVGNLLAIPLMAFWIMPSAFMVCISFLWGDGGGVTFYVFNEGLSLLVSIAHMAQGLPGSSVTVPQFPFWAFLLVVFAGLWFYLIHGRFRHLGPVGAGVILIVCARPEPIPDIITTAQFSAYKKDNTLYFLSMGHNGFQKDMLRKRLQVETIHHMAKHQEIVLDVSPHQGPSIILQTPQKNHTIPNESFLPTTYYFFKTTPTPHVDKIMWSLSKRPWNG
jgi:competence protein ComEC